MRVLLVDDEAGIREGLAALLQLRGHEVRTAADRGEALSQLAQNTFDLVITDWRLPDGNADDVVGRATSPVIAVSGHPEEIAGKERLFGLLQKPILPSKLFAVLEQVAALRSLMACEVDLASLPLDVREVVTHALGLMDAVSAEIADDGVYVTLVSKPTPALLAALGTLGGDPRTFLRNGEQRIAIRWLRDGRPHAGVPVVPAGAEWPTSMSEFAVDFAGSEGAVDVAVLLRALHSARAAGARVHLLNLPHSVRVAIETSDDRHFLPMKERIGPRIPSALADLWS